MSLVLRLKELLAKSGLEEAEVRFYVAVLKKPGATIYELAKIAGVPKDRAYKICEKLVNQSLIDFTREGKWKKLKALPISNFMEKLNSQGRELYKTAEKLGELKSFLPMLAVGNSQSEMSYEFFEDKDAGERFLDFVYLDWENVFGFGDFDSVIDSISVQADKQFINKRVKSGRKSFTVLANPHGYSLELIKNDGKELRDSKVIFSKKISNYFVATAPEVDTMGIWMKQKSGEVSGMIIKNPVLTQLHQNIFEYFDAFSERFKFRDLEK